MDNGSAETPPGVITSALYALGPDTELAGRPESLLEQPKMSSSISRSLFWVVDLIGSLKSVEGKSKSLINQLWSLVSGYQLNDRTEVLRRPHTSINPLVPGTGNGQYCEDGAIVREMGDINMISKALEWWKGTVPRCINCYTRFSRKSLFGGFPKG